MADDPDEQEIDRMLREFGLELPDVEANEGGDDVPPSLDDWDWGE